MKRFFSLALLMTIGIVMPARAAVFMSDEFVYTLPGPITSGQLSNADSGSANTTNPTFTGLNLSGGNWNWHSGTTEFMEQDALGNAVVKLSYTEDISRSSGTSMTAGAGDTWYYSLRFTVKDTRPDGDLTTLGSNYFIHFKDEGTFNFTGRLYLTPPSSPTLDKFSLGLSAYSVNGTGGAINPLGQDLEFDTEYFAVVSFKGRDGNGATTDDGYSKLWVGTAPGSMSAGTPNITDSNPHPDLFIDPDRSVMTRLALRGANAGNQNPDILIDEVAIGNDFEDVLNEISEAAPGLDGDFDGDNDVDGRDFLSWQRGESTNGTPGGPVSAPDLAEWQGAYDGFPLLALTAVPEPTSLGLLALGSVAILLGKRSR